MWRTALRRGVRLLRAIPADQLAEAHFVGKSPDWPEKDNYNARLPTAARVAFTLGTPPIRQLQHCNSEPPMHLRIALAATLLVLSTGSAFAQTAQTVRFMTNVGSFDMVLNPNNDPNLQRLVGNLVAYVGRGRYHFTAVNRAVEGNAGTADDFVLQMGGFNAFPTTPELW